MIIIVKKIISKKNVNTTKAIEMIKIKFEVISIITGMITTEVEIITIEDAEVEVDHSYLLIAI